MERLARIWDSIPRKLKYLALTLLLHAAKAKFPDLPLPELATLDMLSGGGLLGGHILTDVAASLGASRSVNPNQPA